MKKLLILSILALALSCGADALAQSAGTGRTAGGEKRRVDTKSDTEAYEVMKEHASKELNTITKEADEKIVHFNASIKKLDQDVTTIENLLKDLQASLQGENDPKVANHSDTRDLGDTGPVVCNPQTEELQFNTTQARWTCVSANINGCMASQNVWR